MAPRRVQLSRRRGDRKPAGAVVVTRNSKSWGNPYPVKEHGRERAIELYRQHLAESPELVARIRAELAGRDLACVCPLDEPCHGDVLLAVAAGQDPDTATDGDGGSVHTGQDDSASGDGSGAGNGKKAGPSQATRLVELAQLRYTLHVSTDGEPFALPKSGPRIARMLRGGRGSLRAELADAYTTRCRQVPSASALADALTVIEGRAAVADPVALHLRVAEHHGAVYLDLGRSDGACIQDRPGGRVIASH